MNVEQSIQPIPSVLELVHGASEFDEQQATEAVRLIGDRLATILDDQSIGSIDTFTQKVVDPLIVQLNPDVELSGYSFAGPLSVDQPDEVMSFMGIGGVGVRNWEAKLITALNEVGFEPKHEGQTYEMAFVWVSAHELGHGLEEAQAYEQREISPHDPNRWVYSPSSYRYVTEHPDEVVGSDAGMFPIVESERRAEAVAVIMCDVILQEAGLDSEQSAKVLNLIHESFMPADGTAPKTINALGYALPLTIEQLRERYPAA